VGLRGHQGSLSIAHREWAMRAVFVRWIGPARGIQPKKENFFFFFHRIFQIHWSENKYAKILSTLEKYEIFYGARFEYSTQFLYWALWPKVNCIHIKIGEDIWI
jgi:hypothetical protein